MKEAHRTIQYIQDLFGRPGVESRTATAQVNERRGSDEEDIEQA
jgi:hypothetical protein